MSRATHLQNNYEPYPDPQALTSNPPHNSSTGVDYEPHPEKSLPIPSEREQVVKSITNLYSGSASKEDMQVYAEEAVYDDPWSYCDTRYKIAGQWYGMYSFSDYLPHCPPFPPTPNRGSPFATTRRWVARVTKSFSC